MGDLPKSIPSVLAIPEKIKAVLFEVKENMRKAAREETSRKTPIRTAAKSGSKVISALSKNGAV